MSSLRTMAPSAIVATRDLLLVDIRPREERRSELGFLPASLNRPLMHLSVYERRAALDSLGPAPAIVLCCTSGRRSAQLCEELAGHVASPVLHLEGGQLAWGADGYPLCRPAIETEECPSDLETLRRTLLACFVAEMTEVALDHEGEPFDPLAQVAACYRAANIPIDSPRIEDMYEVVDRVGLASYRSGVTLEHVASNVASMYAMLHALGTRLATR